MEINDETKVYVVGDIAGNFDSLMRLVERFTPPYKIIAVGDVIDRGPKSKETIEWLRSSPDTVVLMGNHEWMALEEKFSWIRNGGTATLKSFGCEDGSTLPEEIESWMRALPEKIELVIKGRKHLITHAPVPDPNGRVWEEKPINLWNRYNPVRIDGIELQIFGHNGHLEVFKDEVGEFAICIDDSRGRPRQLCAIELPSKIVINQPLIE